PPRVVSPFEGKLLRVLHCFLGQVPLEQALPVVAEQAPRPPALSRACVELVQESLAKGCLLYLARAGGWRRDRFLRNGQPRDGRAGWGPARGGKLGACSPPATRASC